MQIVWEQSYWEQIEQSPIMAWSCPQSNPRLGENFDPVFRNARLEFSPADKKIMEHLDPDAFHNFTYTNTFYEPLESDRVFTNED